VLLALWPWEGKKMTKAHSTHKSALVGAMLAGAVAVCAATPSKADTIYNVNLTIGTGSVTGTITSDGALGVLVYADITYFDLLLNDGTLTYTLDKGPTTTVGIRGTAVTATATGLFFNLDSTDNPAFLIFVSPGVAWVCWNGTNGPNGNCNNSFVSASYLYISP